MTTRLERHTIWKVVAFAVVAVLSTIALGMRIANLGFFGATNQYEAVFDNASGVFPGDAVKLAGVDVGRVTDTEFENGTAVITFSVDEEVPVTTTTNVGVRWRNVIGLRFLYLFSGTGGEELPDGARIPTDRTDEAGDIGEFLNRLGPILQAIDPEKANAFIDAVNTALSGNEVAIHTLFGEGAYLAGQLGDMDEEISSLIDSSDEIMGAYASQNESIGQIIDDLDTVGGELAGMTTDVNLLVENFAVVQEQMARLLQENEGNIDATIAGLRDVAEILAVRRKDLATTLCSLPAGLAPYDMTSSWGEWFNVRIVEVTFKDERGRTISSSEEDRDDGRDLDPGYVCSRGGKKVGPLPFDPNRAPQGRTA